MSLSFYSDIALIKEHLTPDQIRIIAASLRAMRNQINSRLKICTRNAKPNTEENLRKDLATINQLVATLQ